MDKGQVMRSVVLIASFLGAGCAGWPAYDTDAAGESATEVRAGVVTDMSAFEAFIAGRPTPRDFRRVYPDVLLVMPGDITTQEYRTDNSRYFAQLDGDGRILGGVFR
jgi:hypothetical protein